MIEPIIMGPDGTAKGRDSHAQKGDAMTHYVGIDLGTTNSAICSMTGRNVRLLKKPRPE